MSLNLIEGSDISELLGVNGHSEKCKVKYVSVAKTELDILKKKVVNINELDSINVTYYDSKCKDCGKVVPFLYSYETMSKKNGVMDYDGEKVKIKIGTSLYPKLIKYLLDDITTIKDYKETEVIFSLGLDNKSDSITYTKNITKSIKDLRKIVIAKNKSVWKNIFRIDDREDINEAINTKQLIIKIESISSKAFKDRVKRDKRNKRVRDSLAIHFTNYETGEVDVDYRYKLEKGYNYLEGVVQTEKLCLEAVKKNPFVLKDIINQTEEMCDIAVKNDPFSLMYVAKQTKKLALKAVKKNGLSLAIVSESIKTDKICIEALKQNKDAIKYIKFPTVDMLELV